MECRLETITPKRAQEYLKINTFNRPLRQAHVNKLAEAMKRGEFKVTGDTIKMNGSVLIDGQHRLWAVVQSGVSIQSYVARGVQADAYACIDQGAHRNYGDHLGRAGEINYSALAAAIRFVHNYRLAVGEEQDARFRACHSNQQGDSILADLPTLRDSVHSIVVLKPKGMIGPGPAAAMHCLMSLKDSELATRFWGGVLSGESLSKTMPEYQIRERLLDNAKNHLKVRPVVLHAMAIKAWNARRKGTTIKCLRWTEKDVFPVIE